MPDTKLKVTFVDIEVTRDGDPLDRGEIFWSLKVDGSVITSRSVANPLTIGSGDSITLGQHAIVTKPPTGGALLVVSGSVSEKDSFLGGRDDSASFVQNFTAANDWGTGSPHTARIRDNNLDVTVNFIIERV